MVSFLYLDSQITQAQEPDVDCSEPLDVIYITESEQNFAPAILDKNKVVVVIKDDGYKKLIANNKIKDCASFNELVSHVI